MPLIRTPDELIRKPSRTSLISRDYDRDQRRPDSLHRRRRGEVILVLRRAYMVLLYRKMIPVHAAATRVIA